MHCNSALFIFIASKLCILIILSSYCNNFTISLSNYVFASLYIILVYLFHVIIDAPLSIFSLLLILDVLTNFFTNVGINNLVPHTSATRPAGGATNMPSNIVNCNYYCIFLIIIVNCNYCIFLINIGDCNYCIFLINIVNCNYYCIFLIIIVNCNYCIFLINIFPFYCKLQLLYFF